MALTSNLDFFFKVMCVQYWPPAKEKFEMYGDLEVRILHEEELANFHIRTIRLCKMSGTVSWIYLYMFQQS